MRTYKPIEGVALPTETLAQAINRLTRSHRGDTYQNGVKPGPLKLEQFQTVCRLREMPQCGQPTAEDPIASVKLFDPCGSATWFITEFGGTAPEDQLIAYGLVDWHEEEFGSIDLEGLANVLGRFRIGIEIDMHWTPRPLSQCYKSARKVVEA